MVVHSAFSILIREERSVTPEKPKGETPAKPKTGARHSPPSSFNLPRSLVGDVFRLVSYSII